MSPRCRRDVADEENRRPPRRLPEPSLAPHARRRALPHQRVSLAPLPRRGQLIPAWLTKLTGSDGTIAAETMAWVRGAGTVFYAWHYGDLPQAVDNMLAISAAWGIPTYGTELGCSQAEAARLAAPDPPRRLPVGAPLRALAHRLAAPKRCSPAPQFDAAAAANISHSYWHCVCPFARDTP